MYVHFRFSDIASLQIDDFNNQNVINDLIVEKEPDPDGGKATFKITIEGIYGTEATFSCNSVSVESVEPFSP
ncbi:MAG: Imm50 family immunity protein [Acidobacteriota bacterium]